MKKAAQLLAQFIAFFFLAQIAAGQFTFNRSDGTFAPVGPDGMGGTNGPAITPQGRLSLATGVPYQSANVTGANTIYYTPAKGTGVPIWNGTTWQSYALVADLTNVTTDATTNPAAVAANGGYDLFVWNNAGTLTLSRGPPWTSQFVRNLTLTLQNGIYLNTSAITNGPAALRGTWVGTIVSNGSSLIDFSPNATPASGGGTCRVYVYNYYNQWYLALANSDSGGGYLYNTSAFRQARASANNTCAFLIGDPQGAGVNVSFWDEVTANSAGIQYNGIGIDITTTVTTPCFAFAQASAAAQSSSLTTGCNPRVSQGPHNAFLNEDGGAMTGGANNFNVSSSQIINVGYMQ